jgi:subtilase family protein/Ig-like domain-containing protein
MTSRFGTSRIFFAVTALVIVFGTIPSDSRLAAQQSAGLSPQVVEQIDALMAEKASRTPAQLKMDSQLVYAAKTARGEQIASNMTTLRINFADVNERGVVLDVRADVSDGLLDQMRALGADVLDVSAIYRNIRIRSGMGQIEAIAGLPGVTYVQPKQELVTSRTGTVARQSSPRAPRSIRALRTQKYLERADIIMSVRRTVDGGNIFASVGSSSSEGDATHRAAVARATYGVSGAGVKIGVISNGVTNLAASQASGNLGPVTVLPGQTGIGDEGTAMLEIVHDLAPNAELYFATGFNSLAGFAQNIRNLQASGCTIIVDDVLALVESPFQDGQVGTSQTNGGIIAQAVKDVAAAGVLYFSSAGNYGNKNDNMSGTWEGDFVDGGASSVGQIHNFGGLSSNQFLFDGPVYLFWSDPLGGSTNDYDLYIVNSAGTSVVDMSNNPQNGTQDPYEHVSSRFAGERAVIVKFSGSARFLHLDTFGNQLQISTAGSTHGHAATTAPNSFGVAATPAAAPFTPGQMPGPYPGAFNASNTLESFSSDGPRRIFFAGNGAPLTAGNFSSTGGQVLQKPDFTAADGVSVSGAGGFSTTFFGTSAAAPHAAAIAALVKSRNLAQTATQVRTALFISAIDIEAAGVDRDSGIGIIMADTAVAAATIGPTITTQPLRQTIASGTAATMSVAASGTAPVSYQWYLGTSGTTTNPIGRATGTSYTTPALTITTSYWVRVSNASGAADSTTAMITVTPGTTPPTITTQPLSQTITSGQTATLSVTAGGTAPLTYQWYMGASGTITTPIAGTTGSSYTTPALSSTTSYWVRVSNSVGTADSATATVTVVTPPAITAQPLSQTIASGQVATLSVTATGTLPFNYQWYAGTSGATTSPITGATSSSYTTPALTSTTNYWVRVLNTAGAADSATATVTVVPGVRRDDLALDFGAAGLWTRYNDGSFARLHTVSPGAMAIGDLDGNGKADLIVDFPGFGVWVWSNNTAWFQLHAADAAAIVTGDLDGNGRDDVLVDFPGAGLWVYMNNAGWRQLHTVSPTKLATGDLDGNGKNEAILGFAGYGVWVWANNTAFYQLHTANAAAIVTGDLDGNGKAEVLLDFPGFGLWVWANNAAWSQLHTADATVMTTGDIDGNGKADAIISFSGLGTWAWMNDAAFVQLHTVNPDLMTTGDLDGNGKADVIMNFPGFGLWARMNNAVWTQLHAQNPQGFVSGNLDGN